MNNIAYLLALHSIDGLGPIRLKTILDYFKDPKLAWEVNPNEFTQIGIPRKTIELLSEKRKKMEPEKYADSIQKMNISWLTIFDANYPKLLKEIYDPPIVLFFKGEVKNWNTPAIAVVGTRKITGYGKLVTEQFTRELALCGLTIVSGLARGVDAQAHWTSVNQSCQTWAILGGGLNQIYPAENRNLADKIIQSNGAVISEFPPDAQNLPGNFPARNRIISGLSLAVLVTEAAEDSGSLITAKEALDQGREVFAVPGPITSDTSKGTLLLIKQGARLVTEPEEILQDLGLDKVKSLASLRGQSLKVKSDDPNLNATDKKILESLQNEGLHLDEICRKVSLPISEVSASLIKMEIQGLVKNLGAGNYLKS